MLLSIKAERLVSSANPRRRSQQNVNPTFMLVWTWSSDFVVRLSSPNLPLPHSCVATFERQSCSWRVGEGRMRKWAMNYDRGGDTCPVHWLYSVCVDNFVCADNLRDDTEKILVSEDGTAQTAGLRRWSSKGDRAQEVIACVQCKPDLDMYTGVGEKPPNPKTIVHPHQLQDPLRRCMSGVVTDFSSSPKLGRGRGIGPEPKMIGISYNRNLSCFRQSRQQGPRKIMKRYRPLNVLAHEDTVIPPGF